MNTLQGPEWTLSAEKRAMDIAGATALLPVAIPAMAVAATAISVIDRMSPLYKQNRYGLDGEEFTFYKLRTMPEGTPETPSNGSRAEKRATALGKRLRHLHLDEMPQLASILLGDMSFVGPRALINEDMERTMDVLSPKEQVEWRGSRKTAKPGETGLFQVYQHMSEYSMSRVLHTRAMMDIQYAKTATRELDIEILRKSFTEVADLSSLFTNESSQYGQSVDVLTGIATSMGVTVRPTEQEYWFGILKAARALDDMVDTYQATDITESLQKLIQGVPVLEMTKEQADAFSHAYSILPPDRQALLRKVGSSLPEYAMRKRNAKSVYELKEVCKEEADACAQLMYLPVRGLDMQARIKFNTWAKHFMQAGYMMDTAVDLRKDARSGNVSVQPNLWNRSQFAASALPDMVKGLRLMPPRNLKDMGANVLRVLSV